VPRPCDSACCHRLIDFETTGLSPDMGDRITEVAALRIVGGQIVGPLRVAGQLRRAHSLLHHRPDRHHPGHGGPAPPVAEVVPQLLDFIGSDALSAHNASFDEKFLRAEAPRLEPDAAHASLVCSLKLSRRVFPS
jgi:DNA polymerase-3 subunit epsilon